jgi:hypothetical protein
VVDSGLSGESHGDAFFRVCGCWLKLIGLVV